MDSLRSRIAEFIGLPPISPPPIAQVVDRHTDEGYTRTLLRYPTPDGDQAEAFLFEPSTGVSTAGVIALHQHNSQWAFGKSEIAGLVGDPLQAFGPALARRGVTVVAPDCISFESRLSVPHGDTSVAPSLSRLGGTPEGWTQYYNEMAHRLVNGDLLIRKMLVDSAAAVSVLRQVRPAMRSIGALGHSMGGGTALFLAALDTRLAFTCSSGSVCSYRYKRAHGIGLEMSLVIPGIARHFDVVDLLRCMAPRAVLVVSADEEPATGDATDVVREARDAFELLDAGQYLTHLHVPGRHGLDQQRFDAIVEWAVAQTQRAG